MKEKLSNESKKFLEDLTLYLISSGKKDAEVTEIVEELQEHLTIAESKGKNIKQIVGNSPEDYIKQLSAEINTSKSSIIQYLTLVTLGVISFSFINNLIDGIYTFSLLKLGGTFAISALFIVLLAIVYKKVATSNITPSKEFMLYSVVSALPLLLFIGMIYLDRAITPSTIEFSNVTAWCLAGLAVLFLIGISIWAKSFVVIVFFIALVLPDVTLKFFTINASIEPIVSIAATIIIILVYLKTSNKRD